MKVGGYKITGPSEEILVLPRDPHPIVFRARAVPDMDEFFKLCPEPKPPGKLTKDGFIPDENDAGYQSVLENHTKQRLAWLVVHSLEPSDIEWESVKLDHPKTWSQWDTEMKESGLTQIEVNRIVQLVLDANSLNEQKLQRAREAFLLGRVQAQNASSSQSIEPQTSLSGEPVAD